MTIDLSEITWAAVAAVATLAAVVVALVPIWRDARRRKAHAKSLRIRLCSKLTLLRPSLGRVVQGGLTNYPAAVLTREEFRETVRSIGAMMQESSVLKPGEQDRLGMAFANLEMTAGLYDTRELTVDSAKNVLELIDEAVSAMEKCGLLHRPVQAPWENSGKEQSSRAG
ncbi:MAG: hypothetical protein HY645_15360 [Acidobacteria bacterium]|nr:hypothetical protein [Acidobacteriota bacterium]